MPPTPLSTSMLKRVKKEMERDELFGQLLDNTYLYLPIKLHPSLQKRTEAKGVDPALIFTLSEYPWRPPVVHFCSVLFFFKRAFNPVCKFFSAPF